MTGSLAASKVSPLAPSRLGLIYVDDAAAMAEELDLREAEVGANVMLLVPFDDVVFERTWDADGLRCVALSQLAVDLLTSPGRGPAEVEPVLARLA